MTTAFQHSFQSNAFQIAGGVAATDFQATIAFTQDGDVVSLTLGLPALIGAAGGRRQRYVVHINGRRFVGYQEEIYRVIENLAEKDAEVIADGEKPPKRRIVVQRGQEVRVQASDHAPIVLHDFKPIQEDFRRVYLAQLAHELAEIQDEEEMMLLL